MSAAAHDTRADPERAQRWGTMTDAQRAELPPAERRAHIENYRRHTSYIGNSIEQAERGAVALDARALSAPATADVWENPRPIDSSLYQVSQLDPQIIPEPYRDWLADIADRMQCPIDFVAASALVMTSAVIGAGCGIRPKREDDWLVIPNLWGGVIGNPSRLKTPAISAALYPLSLLEKRANQEYEDAQRSYEAEVVGFEAHKSALRDKMKKQATKGGPEFEKAKRDFANIAEPTPPTWRRYRSNDPSVEKMGELLRDNPKGLMLFRDELTGTLASWDKQGRETDRAFYLEAWNGYGSFTTDRIGRGTVHVDNMCVSIFGGIQPAKLTGPIGQSALGLRL